MRMNFEWSVGVEWERGKKKEREKDGGDNYQLIIVLISN